MPAANFLEATINLDSRLGPAAGRQLDTFKAMTFPRPVLRLFLWAQLKHSDNPLYLYQLLKTGMSALSIYEAKDGNATAII